MNLKKGDTNLELPDDMEWSNEFEWTPLTTNTTYLITGAMLVNTAKRLAGRPITLESKENGAWIDYATASALYEFTNDDEAIMELTLADDRKFDVIFTDNPLSIKPVWFASPNSDYYKATIKLITI